MLKALAGLAAFTLIHPGLGGIDGGETPAFPLAILSCSPYACPLPWEDQESNSPLQ